jgi:hypothetical protein
MEGTGRIPSNGTVSQQPKKKRMSKQGDSVRGTRSAAESAPKPRGKVSTERGKGR